jgi:hypothetical protein
MTLDDGALLAILSPLSTPGATAENGYRQRMSFSVVIDIPELTEQSALAMGRKANTAGAPFRVVAQRSGSLFRRRQSWAIGFVDLEDDPSVASETLDHPSGWPQDEAVRRWLENAMRFLVTEAPGGRLSFQAGWPEQISSSTAQASADQFVEMTRAGDLQAGVRYVIRKDTTAG